MVIKIRLFCAAGFSTGMLVRNMRKAAEEKGVEADIDACAIGALKDEVNGLDIALLGPQVSYTMKASKEIADQKGVPLAVIPMS
ncbi:MAG: PTS sugar transporter subunit IIB, partial [Lacrimispora sp.]